MTRPPIFLLLILLGLLGSAPPATAGGLLDIGDEAPSFMLYAYNDVGPGPVVRISFTVPPPEETTDDDAVVWPWILMAAAVAALVAALIFWRRPRAEDYDLEEEREG